MSISVVIPLYNKELYIRRAIESVLIQNTPPAEILVIDDGSTDDSAQVVREFSDPRLRLIQQANSGECAARNRGITEAQNKLVALLDADDEWKPDFLTQIWRLYVNFPDCGIYATAFDVLLPAGKIIHSSLLGMPTEPWIGILPNFFKIIQKGLPFNSSSVALSKQYCLDAGGFPVGVNRGGDIMMWVRMGLRYPFAYSPSRQVLYHTEAINRACNVFLSLEESACAQEIARMLNANSVPADLVEDLREYYALLNIRKGKEILLAGNRSGAKVILNKVPKTTNHRKEHIWWLFWSGRLPSLVLPLVRKLYARFR